MKKSFLILTGFILFAAFSSCASLTEVKADEAAGEAEIEKNASIKNQVGALAFEDPRRQQIVALTWQIQYQRERLKSLELKYLAACYQDKEYREAMTAIESLNAQIRRLILL